MIRSRLDSEKYTRCNGGVLFLNSLRKTFTVQKLIKSRFDKLRDCKVPVVNQKIEHSISTEVLSKPRNNRQSTIIEACRLDRQIVKVGHYSAEKTSVREFFLLEQFQWAESLCKLPGQVDAGR